MPPIAAHPVRPDRPIVPTMLWRGVRRRCAWCGGRGAFFTGWFRKQDDVPDVRDRVAPRLRGLRARGDGDQRRRGASARSSSALAIGVVATWPDVAVVPLLLILGVGAIVLPIVVYPVSYTVWQAVDLAMRPPEPGDGTPPTALTPLAAVGRRRSLYEPAVR